MISVDTVYNTLLTILNKENQGYVSPTEFNLIANTVQNQIFREYFEDENRDKIKKNVLYSGKGYSNLPFNQRVKINQFSAIATILSEDGIFDLPSDLYMIEDDGVIDTNGRVIEEVETSINGYLNNSMFSASSTYPIYYNFNKQIKVVPSSIASIHISYLRIPKEPKWTYTVIDGKEFYDPSNESFQDFELHESEFSNIILRMLTYFGITLREDALIKIVEGLKDKNTLKDNQ